VFILHEKLDFSTVEVLNFQAALSWFSFRVESPGFFSRDTYIAAIR
jgi:hypothetical protein